jgi:hypothetical protein
MATEKSAHKSIENSMVFSRNFLSLRRFDDSALQARWVTNAVGVEGVLAMNVAWSKVRRVESRR